MLTGLYFVDLKFLAVTVPSRLIIIDETDLIINDLECGLLKIYV